MQANRNMERARKKHPFTSYPAAKHPKQQNAVTDIRLQPEDFFYWRCMNAYFSSHNNFANLGSFAKVSVPVRSVIPLVQVFLLRSCVTLGCVVLLVRQLPVWAAIITLSVYMYYALQNLTRHSLVVLTRYQW